MTKTIRPQTSIRQLVALSIGLSMSVGAVCAPALSFAAPPAATAAAPARKGMMKKIIAGGTAAAIVLGGAGWGVGKANHFNDIKQNDVAVALSKVDTLEQSRADRIPNLLVIAKTTGKFETATFAKIAEGMRGAVQAVKQASTPEQQVAASMQMTNAMAPFIALQAQYPQLQAPGQFSRVMDEVIKSETDIQVARERANRAIGAYNAEIGRIPANVVAKMAGYTAIPLFKATESAKAAPQLKDE